VGEFTLLTAADLAAIAAAFEAEYQRTYGIRLDGLDIEVVAWRVTAHGPDIDQDEVRSQVSAAARRSERRPVRFSGGVRDTPVHQRSSLRPGATLNGPVIVEERETTIVILPGWRASVDRHGCIFANREERDLGHDSAARALEQSH